MMEYVIINIEKGEKMKNKYLFGLLLLIISLFITGCEDDIYSGASEPLENPGDVIFTISLKNSACIPVQLTVYEAGTYELFTEYEACRSNQNCNSMLVYTKSVKGSYSYDVMKILDETNNDFADLSDTTYYELYVGDKYVEEGYEYSYVLLSSESLDDFLSEISVKLNACAKADYIN